MPSKLKNLNGVAKWIIVALAVGTIIYNSVVTHVVLKNDVQHLEAAITEIKGDMRDMRNFLLAEK